MPGNLKDAITISWRRLVVPKETMLLGVEGDMNSEWVEFVIPKEYQMFDFNDGKVILIDTMNAQNEIFDTAEPIKEIIDDDLHLYWIVGKIPPHVNGKVHLRIRVIGIHEDFIWQTETAEFNIAPTFKTSDPPEPWEMTYFDQVIVRVSQLRDETEGFKNAAAISADNASISAELARKALKNSPYVDETTNTWWIFDWDHERMVDTGIKATGPKGVEGPQGLPGDVQGVYYGTTDNISQLVVPDFLEDFNVDVTARLIATQKTSVQGKNLFDYKKDRAGSVNTTETLIENGLRETLTTVGKTMYSAHILGSYADMAGKSYTFSCEAVASGSNDSRIAIVAVSSSFTDFVANIFAGGFSNNKIQRTVTIPSGVADAVYVVLRIYSNGNSELSAIGDYVDYTKLQLEEGSTATAYEPFTPNSPSPDYPAPLIPPPNPLTLTHGGKNLLDKSTAVLGGYSDGVGFISATGEKPASYPYKPSTQTNGIAYIVPCKAGKTYTVHITDPTQYQAVNITEYTSMEAAKNATNKIGVSNTAWNQQIPRTYTAQVDGILICTVASLNDSANPTHITTITGTEKIQLEQSSIATTYEPYQANTYSVTLPEELGGLPTAPNEINLATGEITKRSTKAVLDGNEAGWSTFLDQTGKPVFEMPLSLAKPPTAEHVATIAISSHYKAIGVNIGYVHGTLGFGITPGARLAFYGSDVSETLTTFKAYLAAQKAAGTPVQIEYELAIPQILTIEPLKIKAFPGINNFWTNGDGTTSSELHTFQRDTGSIGPQGIQGPKGDPGPQGPAGIDADITKIEQDINKVDFKTINTYVHTRTGNIHNFTGSGSNGKALITAAFQSGDVFAVNGVTMPGYLIGSDGVADGSVIPLYRWVFFIYDGNSISFKGGGAGLAVRVVGQLTQPTNPTDGMVWVNTSVPIPFYEVRSNPPVTSYPNGSIWIKTDNISASPLVELKNDKYRIVWYVVGVYQLINSAWVQRTGLIYWSGAWRTPDSVLYDQGAYPSPSLVPGFSVYTRDGGLGNVYIESTRIVMLTNMAWNLGNAGGAVAIYTAPIDVTSYKSLSVTMTNSGPPNLSNRAVSIGLTSGTTYAWNSQWVAVGDCSWLGSAVPTIDISSITGFHRIMIGNRTDNTGITSVNLWTEIFNVTLRR